MKNSERSLGVLLLPFRLFHGVDDEGIGGHSGVILPDDLPLKPDIISNRPVTVNCIPEMENL